MCRYGAMCERNYCMFKHDQNDIETVESEKDKEEDFNFQTTVNVEDVSKIVEVDNDDETEEIFEQDYELSNTTFVNPSQDEPISSNAIFGCDNCDFKAATKDILRNHKQTNHNWCCICYSSFKNQDKLKTHIKDLHTKWPMKQDWTRNNVKEMSLDKTNKSFGLILVTVVTWIQ